MGINQTYRECAFQAVARHHLLRGRRGVSYAYDAAATLPEHGARVLLMLAHSHANEPAFKELCKKLKTK